jgi:hypothetical protein
VLSNLNTFGGDFGENLNTFGGKLNAFEGILNSWGKIEYF